MADTSQDLGPFKGGRPFKFTDPTALNQAINSYFDSCDPHVVDQVVDGGINSQGQIIWLKRAVMTPQRPYTTSGLARALGTSRQTLLDYQSPEHYSEEIPVEVRQALADTIGDAKRRVEEYAEAQLFEGNANGAKFNLTNNHGWIEKTVQEHEGGFFGQGGRLEVEIVNAEPTPDEPAQAEAEPSSGCHRSDPDSRRHRTRGCVSQAGFIQFIFAIAFLAALYLFAKLVFGL